VDNLGDTVTDTEGGIDRVDSQVDFSLGDGLENLNLLGTATFGRGNALNNTINGNDSGNFLDGGAGADALNGGGGSDTYIVDDLGDRVTDTGEGIDLVESSVSFTLGENLENLTLTGAAISGIGNSLNNTIIGNANDNIINGGAGADAMSGGLGNDSYTVDNLGDTVTDTGVGIDSVTSSVSFTLGANLENLTLTGAAEIGFGNELNNTIIGNANDNIINGGAGADAMSGGLGNDTYTVDNLGDTVTETGAGIDRVVSTVAFTLGENIENLTLLGTADIGRGNALNNTIIGNASDNLLNGLEGADRLEGGEGSDTYVIDNIGDVIVDFGVGIDRVISSISFTLAENLENLDLLGTAATGVGNASNNIINGNDSGNFLDGGAGADTLNGGGGSDTYIVDDLGDRVTDTGVGR
jgi:Ca2+-binding RTX toxin-like protein